MPDAPRKWGYTQDGDNVKGVYIGCPAQVGIHLGHIIIWTQPKRMPRASGDTPRSHHHLDPTQADAPRKWGYT